MTDEAILVYSPPPNYYSKTIPFKDIFSRNDCGIRNEAIVQPCFNFSDLLLITYLNPGVFGSSKSCYNCCTTFNHLFHQKRSVHTEMFYHVLYLDYRLMVHSLTIIQMYLDLKQKLFCTDLRSTCMCTIQLKSKLTILFSKISKFHSTITITSCRVTIKKYKKKT